MYSLLVLVRDQVTEEEERQKKRKEEYITPRTLVCMHIWLQTGWHHWIYYFYTIVPTT